MENLAVVNYDTNNLHLAPYDWRLSYYNLEVRDAYFSRLKTTIEGFKYVEPANDMFCGTDTTSTSENAMASELFSSLTRWVLRCVYSCHIVCI